MVKATDWELCGGVIQTIEKTLYDTTLQMEPFIFTIVFLSKPFPKIVIKEPP